MMLAEAFGRRGAGDSVVRQLEEIRRIPPELPREVRAHLDSSIQLIRAGKTTESQAALARVAALMKVTSPYQASLEEVKSPEGPIAGRPVLTFAPKDFISLQRSKQRPTTEMVKFTDATVEAGLAVAAPPTRQGASEKGQSTLAVGDVDGDGTDDLFISGRSQPGGSSVIQLYRARNGMVRDATGRSGISLPQGAAYARFADYDNDGWLDLFVIGGEGRGHLFRNRGDGSFEDATAKARIADVMGAGKAMFADLDHDGDLDLFLTGQAKSVVYRNNLDGTFTEATSTFGLGTGGSDAAFGDFDGDGRLDVFVAGARATLLRNGGVQRFSDATGASGLAVASASAATAVGDYNNDGFLDLFVADSNGGEGSFWLNKGDATFSRDGRSSATAQALRSAGTAATFVDYDNDGWLDLVAAGPSRVTL